MQIKIRSYAKINFFLEILGKNEDNYHEIESLIGFLGIFDEIEVKKSDKLTLEIGGKYGEFLKNDESENIILKTIKLMAKKCGFEPKIKVKLTKNVPIGAGIGGGSANSAAVILAVNELLELGLSQEKMMEIGLEIGCDVPICLNDKMALVKGIGEEIIDVAFKERDLFVLIVNPNKHVCTAEVFNSLEIGAKNATNSNLDGMDIIEAIKNRKNDLETPAKKILPEIEMILDEIAKQKNCLLHRMSGSGATCFGLFVNGVDAQKAVQNFRSKFPSFYVEESALIFDKSEIK
jgi:4-diphosphocytidyl-2-C-methyl-D-erythritol kinase